MNAVLYIHGQGGNAAECEHYKPFFPGCEVTGLDYRSGTPWEAGQEIRSAVETLKGRHQKLTLIANSIGAYFSMHAGIETMVDRAFFISPVVDLEKVILKMMAWANVTEEELKEKSVIPIAAGEEVSWEILCWVRSHPIRWPVPTAILYAGNDAITSFETIADFAGTCNAKLTVMENGEHWFHTEEQMCFLDNWLRDSLFKDRLPDEEEKGNASSIGT